MYAVDVIYFLDRFEVISNNCCRYLPSRYLKFRSTKIVTDFIFEIYERLDYTGRIEEPVLDISPAFSRLISRN